MTKCPSCQTTIPDDTIACPICGERFGSDPAAPTLLESATQNLPPSQGTGKRRPLGAGKGSISSFESLDGSRFVPGTILAERYRVVGLLGRGGMGEVYRADDLKLGQAVALKFLPASLSADRAALDRFHREVRVARHVSHRNVCRVYDIGETDGHSFLSMEYVKGEELSSLLRRIGRLPHDKGLEISRQLCAGLAAAHDNNVLHRDLKPANVMIDGDGNVRILDFGLAGITEELLHDETRAGTPAYMAPEQLAGKGVSRQSDIYALGLVLFEIFTGKRAFEANSMEELVRMRKDATPTNPSHIVQDIDPLVERIILRCLETEPDLRPTSAIQVAAALPGSDPLAAALAAGETPSPEMVAAAPKEGLLRPAAAVGLLFASLIFLGLSMWLATKVMLHNRVPLEKSPDVLQERARDISRKAGYESPPTDSEYGFFINDQYITHIIDTDQSPSRWDRLRFTQPPALSFWYRQSPRYLESIKLGAVEMFDPPADITGMTGAVLDTNGRLVRFYGIPPQIDLEPAPEDPLTPDWSILFSEAGLDLSRFKSTDPQWLPPHGYDTRVAWEGTYPEQPQIPVRIEAASYRGKPVYFQLINSWDKPLRQDQPQSSLRETALFAIIIGMLLTITLGGIILAVRNIRLGRGDRKGAFRIALAILFVSLSETLFVHHVPTIKEWSLLMNNVANGLLAGSLFWVLYMALEPYVRRRWPGKIISWTRLISGDFRDPLIGRDILIGSVFGIGLVVVQLLVNVLPGWLGWQAESLLLEPGNEMLGIRYALAGLSNQIGSGFLFGFGFLFLLLLHSIILRNEKLALGAMWLLVSIALALGGNNTLATYIAPFTAALVLLPLVRYGLLAMISAQFFHHIWIFYPITLNLTSWYAGSFVIGLVAFLAMMFYAFYISRAGQPLFGNVFLDD